MDKEKRTVCTYFFLNVLIARHVTNFFKNEIVTKIRLKNLNYLRFNCFDVEYKLLMKLCFARRNNCFKKK